jgi:RNA polymerase sigma-B factor
MRWLDLPYAVSLPTFGQARFKAQPRHPSTWEPSMSCENVGSSAEGSCTRSASTTSPWAVETTDTTFLCVECLVLDHLPLAHNIANRYRNRGVDDEDLIQVARLGLVLAARRFDPARGDFKPFAIPTITGEIRRYFRDTTWEVRVPRRIQELVRTLRDFAEEATQESGQTLSSTALARRAGISSAEVQDARRGAAAYKRQSLDQVGPHHDSALADMLPQPADPLEIVDELESLAPAVRELDFRAARILYMRFYQDLTQAQIGAEIGVSQMHVSRLLNRVLDQLRHQMEAPPHEDWTHSAVAPPRSVLGRRPRGREKATSMSDPLSRSTRALSRSQSA